MAKNINVKGVSVSLLSHKKEDFISLTDMAKFKNPNETSLVISHWLSTRYTIEFIGCWERFNNPNFNTTEFSSIKNESGSNGFVLTTKRWIDRTNAIGITSKAGRYDGGTFAHSDIACKNCKDLKGKNGNGFSKSPSIYADSFTSNIQFSRQCLEN